MKIKYLGATGLLVLLAAVIGIAITAPGNLDISQQPLFTQANLPPLNMLVVGRDHKLYYEAYNDASDLNDDKTIDVGYKPSIKYYGYYNSDVCYTHDGDKFVPSSAATNKQCSGKWSGDFLNYVTTSRMDALRKVLYGGYRATDTDAQTILQASFTPQDAHSWGKEYQSVARDGYDIANYTPLSVPASGRYHLFAVTTLSDNGIPRLRVLKGAPFRIWNWVSIERPVAGSECTDTSGTRVDCVYGSLAGDWVEVPESAKHGLQTVRVTTWKDSLDSPTNLAGMNSLFDADSVLNRCGSNSAKWSTIYTTGANNNPFTGVFNGGCSHNNYHTRITATLTVSQDGTYYFAVSGDDAVDLSIDGTNVVGWYGGHGATYSQSALSTHAGSIYLKAGTHTLVFRHEEGSGDDNWQLYWKPPAVTGASGMDNYNLRVEVCPKASDKAALRDATCKSYPSNTAGTGAGNVKPTGILHDYGESNRMYFGLLTGSYSKNTSGGVLRTNMGSFTREVNANTGIFTSFKGIQYTLSTFRMLDFNYSNHEYGCGWAAAARPVNEGECWMWGNPISEMMYETLRYFGGATAGRSEYTYGSNAVDLTTLALPAPTWAPPYTPTSSSGGGYPMCSQPAMTVMSDINPSYDGNLPGSHWDTTFSGSSDPSSVSGFNASAQADAIWAAEGGGSKQVFIGESAGVVDNAPTPKTASNFSTLRGLSPEEPSKQGTFYSASVARYGALNNIGGRKSMRTYSVALASPLPSFNFPVGNGSITLVPFAKSVSGSGIDPAGNFQPTDQIVDFYVQKIANTSSGNRDANVNGGLPYAEFRINYEDVEQGADHDMDAIVLYKLEAFQDGGVSKLRVTLTSEYAAGSITQHMGYVISGTSQDGVYLEVRDQGGSTINYKLNTPAGRSAGYCTTNPSSGECNGLPLTAERVFTPGQTAGASILNGPLWYAAKYGTTEAWDADNNGVPDNYFLVTNPLYLKEQLTKTFDAIQRDAGASGSVAVSGARVSNGSYTVAPSYAVANDGKDWTGDLQRYELSASTGLPSATATWSAAAKLNADNRAATRHIYFGYAPGNSDNRSSAFYEFKGGLISDLLLNNALLNKLGLTASDVSTRFGVVTSSQIIDYLRGVRSMEGSKKDTAPFRVRSSIMGDVINSAPVIQTKRSNYGWALATGLTSAEKNSYSAYVTAKADASHEYIYVGANDGMLHAFNDLGEEEFAYIPNSVLGKMGMLLGEGAAVTGAYAHQFYVDGQQSLGDYYDGGWKTAMVGAAGAGGRGVYALNVSAPASFTQTKVLWDITSATDADIGYVMGKPLIAKTKSGQWVAIFGNGYNSSTSDPYLFIVNLVTGKVLKKIKANDGDDTNANGLGNIAAVDSNGDGLVDLVYGGDLRGNVWKFDISAADASNWAVANGGSAIFVAKDASGNRQPITGGFEVASGPGSGYMLYFGSGRYFVNGDNGSSIGQQVQSLYGFWDNGASGTIDRTTKSGSTWLMQQQVAATEDSGRRTISRNTVSYVVQRGWYVDLYVTTSNVAQTTGEKFIGNPVIQSGRVVFETYQPGEQGTDCKPGGQNWRYGLNLLTGAAQLGPLTDSSGKTVGTGDTGAVSTSAGAPNREPAVTQPSYTLPSYCDTSTDPSCAGTQKCTEVIIDPGNGANSLTTQRACGRQSWRQLR